MENKGAHLIMDDAKVESSQASDLALLNLTGSKGLEPHSQNNNSSEKRGQGYGDGSPISNFCKEWQNVSYSDIKVLTDNFSESLMIGEGGFGKVYRGQLYGRPVAIKILDSTSKQGEREFFQEIQVLHKMRHPHLVELVGACFEEVRALVYDFLPRGSLEDCLKESPEILTWQMRIRIIYEICSALSYLHSKYVIHADLKPANVLLDANFKSKLSDFGLCRILPQDAVTTPFLETNPMGTLGYMDPWFLQGCILRYGSDLYSLGVTILRLLTRMSPIGLALKIRETDENSLHKMIDPSAGNWPIELAKEMVYWSLQCCFHNQNSSKVLMDMSTCLLGVLAEIDALQGENFEPEKAIRHGSRGLNLWSSARNKDKEVMGAINPPLSWSFSEVRKIAGRKLVHFDSSLEFKLDDLLLEETSIYGKLYVTALEDGKEVAVKRFKRKIVKGQREFESEVNVLGNARHPNLLALRAYHFDPKPDGEKLLVFDPMPGGSLAAFKESDVQVTWSTTMNTIIGIARGLNYLHEMNIIHGNLTSANIFLDENNTNAKISDHELSRLITPAAFSKVIETTGALGYRAPELFKLKEANTKTDVYSLGAVVLELLIGVPPAGNKLVEFVRLKFGEILLKRSLMPPRDRDVGITILDELLNTVRLGLDCVDPSPASRPEVLQVLQQLEEFRAEMSDAYEE